MFRFQTLHRATPFDSIECGTAASNHSRCQLTIRQALKSKNQIICLINYRTPQQVSSNHYQHEVDGFSADQEQLVRRPNSIEIRRSYQREEVSDVLSPPSLYQNNSRVLNYEDHNPYQHGMYGQGPLRYASYS